MLWLILFGFAAAEAMALFAFYRVFLRPLPAKIDELLFEHQLKNGFEQIATDTADLVRAKLLDLEAERLEAVVEYEALKGRRLTATDSAKREAFKKATERLTKQIDSTRRRLNQLYAPSVLSHLRKFEERKFVVALNKVIDESLKRGESR